MNRQVLAIGIIAIVAFVLITTVELPVGRPFMAGGNLYDSEGNFVGTIETAEGTLLDVYFRDPISRVEIAQFEGFFKLRAHIQDDVISLPDGVDADISYGMWFGMAISTGVLIQSGASMWHIPDYDETSGDPLPEWTFTYDIIQLIDYYDDTNPELYKIITRSDGSTWVSYTFPFRFVAAVDWTTDYGVGGYRKMIPIYLNVEVVDVDASTAIQLNFFVGEYEIGGGSLDTEYTPYDGLNNLPPSW